MSSTNRKNKKLKKTNGKKNHCMDASSNKLERLHNMTWTCDLIRGNLKRESESLLIVAQNNTIRTNYIMMKTDNTQQNSKCRLCEDSDKMVNCISNNSKPVQKEYKARHDWVGKVIHWEMCNRLEFDHIDKW